MPRGGMLALNENQIAVFYKKDKKTNIYDEVGRKFTFKQADLIGQVGFQSTKGMEIGQFQPLGGMQTTNQTFKIHTTNSIIDFEPYDRVKLVGREDRMFTIVSVINLTSTTYTTGQKRTQKALARFTPKVLILQ